MLTRALGLVLGFGLDRFCGDPRRGHPVALFGQAAAALERRAYAASTGAGAAHVGLLVAPVAGLAWLVQRAAARHPVADVAWTAAVAWAVLGGRSLEREVAAVAAELERGDLPAARAQVSRVVGRDPWSLDEAGVARAAIETLAENSSDAVVASLVWGAVAGPAGMVAHRAVNTLDAMIGHRNARYERFGKVAARADDAVNWVPARLGAALAAGGSRAAWHAIRHDAPHHPSPNGGPIEAAFAGALGVQLGGANTYAGRAENRGVLGAGPPPAAADVARAIRLARRVHRGSLLVTAGVAAAAGASRRLRSRW